MGHMNMEIYVVVYYSKHHCLQMSVKYEDANLFFVSFSYNQQKQQTLFWNKSDCLRVTFDIRDAAEFTKLKKALLCVLSF